jgi:hypothetical protein
MVQSGEHINMVWRLSIYHLRDLKFVLDLFREGCAWPIVLMY